MGLSSPRAPCFQVCASSRSVIASIDLCRVCARAHPCRSSVTSRPTHAAPLEPRSGDWVSPGRFWSQQTPWAGREMRAPRFGEPRSALYPRCQQQSPSGSSQGAFLVIWRRFTEEIIRTMWASCSPRDACCSPQYAQVLGFLKIILNGLSLWRVTEMRPLLGAGLTRWVSGDGRALVQPRRLLQQMHGQEELHHNRLDTRIHNQAAGPQVSVFLLFKPLTLTLWGLHFNIFPNISYTFLSYFSRLIFFVLNVTQLIFSSSFLSLSIYWYSVTSFCLYIQVPKLKFDSKW